MLHPHGFGNGQNGQSEGWMEELVTQHFTPVYVLVNSFLEDPAESLVLSQALFFKAQDNLVSTAPQLYRMIFQLVDFHDADCEVLEKMNFTQAACWLLKDLTPMGYAEIGEVLSLSREQVRVYVAQARDILLAKVC
ncbi:MAG: hypothetical protein OEV94_04745 [Deltaproteobacteria bacterium]|nr:hypothetical protein [Deltaproteobacteria bacterium]